jgi:hypothetical protein
VKTIALTLAAFVLAAPAFAGPGAGSTAPGKGSSSPPSRSKLPNASAVATSIATPFAWVDDASLLPAGSGALTVGAATWIGANASESTVPIVAGAAGLAPRFQLSAQVPYIVGDDAAGIAGGWGTSYLTGKIALLQQDGGLKLAVAPTLQLLGASVVLSSTDSRAHWGIPVSAEFDAGSVRVFASGGYFSGGIGFVGAGVGVDVHPRISLSGTLSRAWSSDSVGATTTIPGTDRTEIVGGAAFNLTSHVAIFGSIGQTIATSDANGAGTTLVGGLLFVADRGKTRHGRR